MTEAATIDLKRLRRETRLAADYPRSFLSTGDLSLWLERDGDETSLAVLFPADSIPPPALRGRTAGTVLGRPLLLCPRDAHNAGALRALVPVLRPVPLGLHSSAGFGDRLGLATPGHVRALRRVNREGESGEIGPIFAQQSIREMERTGRSAQNVLDDATWGAFQEGWRAPLGADADHLKTPDDIDRTAACGYSFYTIDPGAYVDDAADVARPAALERSLDAVPWEELETSPSKLRRWYVGKPIELETRTITLDDEALTRAVAKYGRAIAHVRRMYRHLIGKQIPFELEMSVDETETPTSHAEHAYIASELRRLNVQVVSLAPRFVGSFEKGVDYLGDPAALRADLEGHAAVARALGPYKLSLHSGSDKFLVYPLIQEATGGLVHLKTAGTSYLEALRVSAALDPHLFRAMLRLARECYERDRATYHVSAQVGRVPDPTSLGDEALPGLLDDFDARQVLHVTFGSILAIFGTELRHVLSTHEEAYATGLERHFVRHLQPFAAPVRRAPPAST